MALITNFSYNSIVNNLDIIKRQDISEDFFCKNIYDNPTLYSIFNKLYLRKIYINAYILRNDFEPKYFKKVPIKEDKYTHVFSRGGKPTYHIYEDCQSLNNSYRDFVVPFIDPKRELTLNEVKLVKEFRNWFIYKDFRYKLESKNVKMDDIVFDYNNYFAKKHNLKTLPLDYTFKTNITNSGFIGIQSSFDVNSFKNEIEDILYASDIMCQDENLLKMRNFDWMRKLPKEELLARLYQIFDKNFIDNYGEVNIRDFMNKHYKLRESAFKKTINYLKWTYGLKNKSFNEVNLEHFGFKLCSFCETQSIAI
ncbi:hypothetical protein [Patiriisocius sp. Uisw_017]|uniref:hypothetical protein n=1 Tax=Patiriisocius sp. Uisw_017 TaxID=3230968 RepID=UPI0039ED91E3